MGPKKGKCVENSIGEHGRNGLDAGEEKHRAGVKRINANRSLKFSRKDFIRESVVTAELASRQPAAALGNSGSTCSRAMQFLSNQSSEEREGGIKVSFGCGQLRLKCAAHAFRGRKGGGEGRVWGVLFGSILFKHTATWQPKQG